MRLWSTLFNFFAVLLLLYFVMVLQKDLKENAKQFDELHLKYAVDYATEAAFHNTLDGNNLGINYIDLASINLNADNTLATFKGVLALTYDISPSPENLQVLDSYISSAVLATPNGYYIAELYEMDKAGVTEYSMKWGLKKPYTIEYNNGNTQIAYTLGSEDWRVSTITETGFTNDRGNQWDTGVLGRYEMCATPDLDECKKTLRQKITLEVNKQITNEVNLRIKQRNEMLSGDITHQFVYLPARQTQEGVNPIERPSLFVTLSGVDFVGVEKLNTQSVGGFTVASLIQTIGFEIDGLKYYALEGQIPDAILTNGTTKFFSTPEQAARQGYMPHLEFLQNTIKTR